MSLLLSTTLLASIAAAQLTTSIWLPGAANANQSFIGSVVAQTGDRTTLSVAFDGSAILTEYYGTGPGFVTVEGTTYMAYQQTATDAGSDNSATVDLTCSRANEKAVPTCAYTMRDFMECSSQIGTSTTTYVVTDTPQRSDGDFSPLVRTVTETLENLCTGVVESGNFAQTTSTLSGDQQYFLNNYRLVITAGTEKLNASAAATPAGSGAQSTVASMSLSAAGSSGATQATGAAAPVRTIAPVLAGLGAAAAFFV